MNRTFTSRIARGTAVALAGLMLGAVGQATAAPVIDRSFPAPTPNAAPDPFYTPPATLPAGEPGDVIRARPSKAGPPTARSLANAWQVMYLSTDALQRRNVVTGTVLVPKGKDPATTPVVAFNAGTSGPAFKCTVSRFINSGAFYEQSMINRLLQAGYAVSVTDYEGYKQNPNTSYMVGKAMGPAVLDGVRAATRLPEAGLSPNAKVVVHGFSQGGGASMWAGQLQPTYAPEINLQGVSGGGVPANLASVAIGLNGKPGFGFMLYALIGLDNAYSDELQLGTYLNAAGTSTLAAMEAGDCTIELLLGYDGKQASDYMSPLPFGQLPWLLRIAENTLGSTKINVPVYQYHAPNDPIVEYDQARQLRDKYCGLGMSVTWKEFDTGHVTTVGRGNTDALAFIADRFSGKPASSSCGQ